MAAAKYQTQIVVSAINKSQQVFAGVNKMIDQTTERLNKMGTQMQLAGFRTAAAVGFPAQRFVGDMLEAAKSMSQAENQLEAVLYKKLKQMDDGGAAIMKQLEGRAKAIAAISPFDTIEATDAQKYLAMAGMGPEQVLGATKSTVAAASAMSMAAATTADKLSNAVLSFGLMDAGETDLVKIESAFERVADVAAYTASSFNVSGEQFFESMKSLGPVAVGTGSDIERMATMIGLLGNKGIQGGEAGVALRSSIARMLAPTKQVREALAALNIDMGEFITYKDRADVGSLFDSLVAGGTVTQQQLAPMKVGIQAIMQDDSMGMADRLAKVRERLVNGLKLNPTDAATLMESFDSFAASAAENFDFEALLKRLQDNNATMGQLSQIFGKYHYTKMASLVQNAELLDLSVADMRKLADGSVMSMLQVQMKGLFGWLEKLRAAWSNMLIGLGMANEGPITMLIANMIQLINWFDRLDDGTKQMVLAFGAIAIAAGPLLIYVGLVTQGLGALLGAARMLSVVLFAAPRALAAVAGGFLRLSMGLPITALMLVVNLLKETGFLGKAFAGFSFGTLIGESKTLSAVYDVITNRSGPAGASIQRLTGNFGRLKETLSGAFKALSQGDSGGMWRQLSLAKYAALEMVGALKDLGAAALGVFTTEAFGGKLPEMGARLVAIWGALKSTFMSIFSIAGNVGEVIKQAFAGISDQFSGDAISSGILVALDYIVAGVDLVAGAFGWLAERVADFTASGKMREWASASVAWLKQAGAATVEYAGIAWDYLSPALASAWEWTKRAGAATADYAKVAWTKLSPALQSAWEWTKRAGEAAWDFGKKVYAGTGPALQSAVAWLKDASSAAWDFSKAMWAASAPARSDLLDWLKNMGGMLSSLGQSVAAFASGFAEGLGLDQAFADLVEWWNGDGGKSLGFIKTAFDGIAAAVDWVLGLLGDLSRVRFDAETWHSWGVAAGEAMQSVGRLATDLPGMLATAGMAVIEWAQGLPAATDGWHQSFTGGIVSIQDSITAFATNDLPAAASSAAAAVSEWAQGMSASMDGWSQSFAGWIVSIQDKIAVFASEVLPTIAEAISSVTGGLSDDLWAAIVAAYDFVMSKIGEIGDMFKGVGQAIADAIMGPISSIGEVIAEYIAAAKGLLDFGFGGGEVETTDGVATQKAPAPFSGIPIKPQQTPMSFAQSGVETPTTAPSKDIAELVAYLKESGVKTDGEITVALRLPPGVQASGVATSRSGPELRLDTGISTLAQ